MSRGLLLGDSHFVNDVRFGECVRIHDWVADLAEHEKPDFIAHGGDVHDALSTPIERQASSAFVQRCADVAPTFIARGNHDRERDLLILAKLKARHPIVVCETAGVFGLGDLGIALMAWPSRASALDEEGTRTALRNVLGGDVIHGALSRYPNRLLVGHFMATGAVTGKGQPLIGDALNVSLEDLALAGAHFNALGHIHASQSWEYEGVTTSYSGSPFRTDYGESESKSVTMVTIENGVARYERIPTPARPMVLVEGMFDGERLVFTGAGTHGGDHLLHDVVGGESLHMADVRLHYTVAPEFRPAARAASDLLKAEWLALGAADVKIEPETLVNTRSRAPEVAAAQNLPDKVRAYWRAKGLEFPLAVADRTIGRIAQLGTMP